MIPLIKRRHELVFLVYIASPLFLVLSKVLDGWGNVLFVRIVVQASHLRHVGVVFQRFVESDQRKGVVLRGRLGLIEEILVFLGLPNAEDNE